MAKLPRGCQPAAVVAGITRYVADHVERFGARELRTAAWAIAVMSDARLSGGQESVETAAAALEAIAKRVVQVRPAWGDEGCGSAAGWCAYVLYIHMMRDRVPLESGGESDPSGRNRCNTVGFCRVQVQRDPLAAQADCHRPFHDPGVRDPTPGAYIGHVLHCLVYLLIARTFCVVGSSPPCIFSWLFCWPAIITPGRLS